MSQITSSKTAEAVPRVAAGPWVPPYQSEQRVDPDQNNIVRKFSLALGLIVVFLRVSAFHQVEAFLLHVNLRLLYLFGIPALLGTVLCGGVRRTFRASPGYFWVGYALWMVIAVPFSTWRAGSAETVSIYIRTNLIMLFLAGGLVVEWKECQALMKSMVWGAIGTLLVARLFQNPLYQDRFGIELGTVANPNDFACHLLLCLPFLYWAVLSSKNVIWKMICLAGIAYGVVVVIQTASRGALIALVIVVLCLVAWGSAQQKLAVLVLIPIGFLGVVSVVSPEALRRIISFSSSEKNASEEALLSSDERHYLLNKSIEYTFTHPIFGVGAAQFPVFEGTHNQVIGTHGSWHGTHNTFTQVSSETGIPGLLLFAGGILAIFKVFYSVFRKAKQRSDCTDMRNAALCLMLATIGFTVSFTFLNFAYFFYQPLLGGLAVAVKTSTDAEFAKREREAAVVPAAVMSPLPFRRAVPGTA